MKLQNMIFILLISAGTVFAAGDMGQTVEQLKQEKISHLLEDIDRIITSNEDMSRGIEELRNKSTTGGMSMGDQAQLTQYENAITKNSMTAKIKRLELEELGVTGVSFVRPAQLTEFGIPHTTRSGVAILNAK